MKVARPFDTRKKRMERPGEKAGLMSSLGSVVNRSGVREPISFTYIEVVLLVSVPGEGHLIAVRGKTRGPLRTRIAREWDLLGCGCWFSGSPAKEPAGDSYCHDSDRCCRPNPGPPGRPNRGWCPGQRTRVRFLLQFSQLYLEIIHMLKTLSRLLPQEGVDDLLQIARRSWNQLANGLGFLFQDGHQRRHLRVT